MPEDKPEIEKAEPRIIEVNEWFTPVHDYDQLPYDTNLGGKPFNPDKTRSKTLNFQLANVGNFEVNLWWDRDISINESEDYETYLLVLPNSERIVKGSELKQEQEKMETRPIRLDVEFLDQKLQDKTLPYRLEIELPSGEVISADFSPMEGDDEIERRPQTYKNWVENNQGFDAPYIPEVSNIINKLQLRFVQKD